MLYYTFHRLSSCFTAGGKNAKWKKGKAKGKSKENAPHPRGGRGHRHANGKPHARKTAGTARNR